MKSDGHYIKKEKKGVFISISLNVFEIHGPFCSFSKNIHSDHIFVMENTYLTSAYSYKFCSSPGNLFGFCLMAWKNVSLPTGELKQYHVTQETSSHTPPAFYSLLVQYRAQ